MKTLYKCTAAAVTAIMLCSCSNETAPQTVTESTYTEIIETTQTETTENEVVSDIESVSETESEAIVYEKIVHNYNRKFYDFLEITEDFYGDNEAFETTEEGMQIKAMFKEFIEQSGVTVTDIRITQTVTDDLNIDGEFETAAVVTAGFEADETKTEERILIGTGEIKLDSESKAEWSGLYFISSNGDIRLESDCQIISIDREFIYPDSKQLDVSFLAYDMMYISDRVYGYSDGKITALLDCGHTLYKDCCFLYLPAAVGPFYPISPAMFYWDSEQEDYLTVNAVPVSKEDFEEILNSAPENDDMEDILQQFSQCAYIMNIGNRFYILREGDRGDLAVILDNDGSLEISHNMWNYIFTFTYDSPADVDYFAAVDSMIKV